MKKLLILLTGATVLFLSACGDPYISLVTQEKVDAAELKSFCASKKLVTDETKQADKEFAQGQTALKEGNSQGAFTALGQAAALYKIAISDFHASKANTKIETLSTDLKKDKESLTSYQNLLADIQNQPAATVEAPNEN